MATLTAGDCQNPASDYNPDAAAAIDRITWLPDDVRLHILSFLRTEDAVKTSGLSKEWQFLWTSVSTIDLSFRIGSKKGQYYFSPEIIDKTLTLHSSHKIIKFAIAVPRPMEDALKPRIDDWLRFAVTRRVEVLKFYCRILINRFEYLLPSFLFNNPVLSELTITHCHVHLIPARVHLPCLKKLFISGVMFRGGCSVGDLLSGCPSLQYLQLMRLYTGGENKLTLSSSSLKQLTIGSTDPVLEVSAPKLQTLTVYGDLCFRKHRLMDVSSLVHVTLGFSRFAFRTPQGITMSELTSFKELLQQLKKVQQLTLRTFGMTYSQAQSDNTILEEAKAFWRSQQKEFGTFACLRFTIQRVKFIGFVPNKFGWEFMDPLVEFILNNALVLKEMVISWNDRTVAPNSKEAQELCIAKRQVLDYKRASPKARVVFQTTN